MSWVKKPTEESDIFWQRWLKNHPESHEEFKKAQAIILRINFQGDQRIGERKEELLDLILRERKSQHYVEGESKKTLVLKLLPTLFRLAAACVVVILMATYLFSEFPVKNYPGEVQTVAFRTKSNPKGQKSIFFLPDKTKVILNAASQISFPEEFNANSREVFLEGEAFFDVTHDANRKFLVRSGEVVTEVHGTAFNVQAYSGEPVSIALQRGLVSVYPALAGQPTIPQYLKPGEMITVSKDFETAVISQFDFEEMLGWQEGKLVFKRATMETLIKRLERWFDVEIEVEGKVKDSWKINGIFKNENLVNVLEGVRYARNIDYQINGNKVTIRIKNNQ
ncbi:FecR domain-containing protein [Echinicola sp. CAU 1574]|uniref:FecR domain-containing protein n=1 Tax=Echinicola arenosa TaxID=2774144 RepID=A0ABR9AFY5_9BACT|nr:FecR domain-containing protein [Echinicola arenosa]MBD8487767.1 FecR domain-containing protein [Echinicola arenosa]